MRIHIHIHALFDGDVGGVQSDGANGRRFQADGATWDSDTRGTACVPDRAHAHTDCLIDGWIDPCASACLCLADADAALC